MTKAASLRGGGRKEEAEEQGLASVIVHKVGHERWLGYMMYKLKMKKKFEANKA